MTPHKLNGYDVSSQFSRSRDLYVIYSEDEVENKENNWRLFARKMKYRPLGCHHMGMPWQLIFSIVPSIWYKSNVQRIIHRKLGPRNISCIRQEKRGRRLVWIESVHWEGHCPGCKKIKLEPRTEKDKRPVIFRRAAPVKICKRG